MEWMTLSDGNFYLRCLRWFKTFIVVLLHIPFNDTQTIQRFTIPPTHHRNFVSTLLALGGVMTTII